MDLKRANRAINLACGGGVVSGLFTLNDSIIAWFGYSFARAAIFNFLGAILIFGMTFGIYKKNKVCAIILFVYWVASKSVASKVMYVQPKGYLPGIFIAILFGYFFFEGIRGTFAYHKIVKSKTKPDKKTITT